MPLTVVIAPDSFKGSLSARKVSEAIATGWSGTRPHDTVILLPQADGGEGTIEAVETALPGTVRHDAGLVHGPDGNLTDGVWLELPGRAGLIELAQSSGLPLMHTPDPLGATTFGLGEVIRDALRADMESLVIGLGGSASTDGAAGALTALGLTLLNPEGKPVALGGGGLLDLADINRSGLLAPPIGGVTLLTEVSAPLTGLSGAARVFGPQKGADPHQVAALDAALSRFSSLLGGDPELPGSGAAGGAGYGFSAAWGATIVPGARHLASLSGLTTIIGQADVLITGEGRFDATSLTGKVVGEAIRLADAQGLRLGIVAGQVSAAPGFAAGRPIWATALAELAGSVQSAIEAPVPALHAAGSAAARHFGACSSRNA
ncbi:MAG: glycerate kinase family protein [Microbacteriaceae bacterium]